MPTCHLAIFYLSIFRIYLPFISFWTFWGYVVPEKLNQYTRHLSLIDKKMSYIHVLALELKTDSHLWTIPVKIKFYFFIPFIALMAAKSGRHWYAYCLVIVSFVLVIENVNPFNNLYANYYRNWMLKEFITVFILYNYPP
jgi:peptidoglycan/LPS O-acetylase OafA/YrhL